MPTDSPVLFFDYVDPVSYVLDRELEGLCAELDLPPLVRVGVEMRAPPADLIDLDGPWWRSRWRAASVIAQERGIALTEPTIVPWTRKAHELVRHAATAGLGNEAHHAVFDTYFGHGIDIGRVDVLVRIATDLGMDPRDAKAVLDVDRFAGEVIDERARVEESGIRVVPTLRRTGVVLEGFHNRDALRTFLCSP